MQRRRFYSYRVNAGDGPPRFYRNLKRLCELEGLNYNTVYRAVLRRKDQSGNPVGTWTYGDTTVSLCFFED